MDQPRQRDGTSTPPRARVTWGPFGWWRVRLLPVFAVPGPLPCAARALLPRPLGALTWRVPSPGTTRTVSWLRSPVRRHAKARVRAPGGLRIPECRGGVAGGPLPPLGPGPFSLPSSLGTSSGSRQASDHLGRLGVSRRPADTCPPGKHLYRPQRGRCAKLNFKGFNFGCR